jgi:hypothetical protein
MRPRPGDQWPRHKAKAREQRRLDTRKGRRKLAALISEGRFPRQSGRDSGSLSRRAAAS